MADKHDQEDVDDIMAIYDSDESPLCFIIEPKGSVDFVPKDHKTTKEELESIFEQFSES